LRFVRDADLERFVKNRKNDGRRLEHAVRVIQQALLRSDPGLKGGEFTIEANKHFTISGSKHEVDIYVVTRPGTTYEAKVLFECKDWTKPVSKNAVIILKEKVELLGAARGILVARRITKDARAMLAQCPRLEFRRFDNDLRGIFSVEVFHAVHDPAWINVRITSRPQSPPFPKDLQNCLCLWGDRLGFLQTFANERVEAIAHQDQAWRLGNYEGESVHWYATRERLEFSAGEFTLRGIEIAALELQVAFFVKISRKSPCFRCSVDGDGQVHTFEITKDDWCSRPIELSVVVV